MYKTQKSFDVIKGVVPNFKNNIKSDVNVVAMKFNGETVNVIPPKAKYAKIEAECDNGAIGKWDETNWGLLVTNLSQSPTSCSVEFTMDEGHTWTFGYTGDEQAFMVLCSGRYQIELWGAQGGSAVNDGRSINTGGKGAYTKGEIELHINDTYYIYVGGAGTNALGYLNANAPGGYNGGGSGTSDGEKDSNYYESSGGGGGATDIRLVNGNWKDFEGLKSRIMVAAGGGGASFSYAVGAGGGLIAPTVWTGVTPASQTGGYAFGYGQDGFGVGDSDGVGGGGSGYYGGGTQNVKAQSSGTGGSSFISGHEGCDAITKESTVNHIVHTGLPTHYSGLTFTNTTMTANTRSGSGYAKITYLGS